MKSIPNLIDSFGNFLHILPPPLIHCIMHLWIESCRSTVTYCKQHRYVKIIKIIVIDSLTKNICLQVNMPADSFESPLTLAACGGHVELAMLLLERGANIEEVR